MNRSDKPWDARLAYHLIYPLRNTAIGPNHLTSLRLLFGLLACFGLASGDSYATNIGAGCFVLSHFLDHTDGELARLSGKSSRAGHYYDLASDAIVNTALFFGLGLGLLSSPLGGYAGILGIIAGLAVAAIFHMRNQIEQDAGKTAARQPRILGFEIEDMLYLLPIIILQEWQLYLLILSGIGAPLFALWVSYQYRRIRGA